MPGQGDVSEQRRGGRWPVVLVTGAAIGVVEAVSAIAFAALVFGGWSVYFVAEGIALYLGGAALVLAILAWRAGNRGVVGGLQATGAALLAVVAATTGIRARGGPIEGFLAVVAATVLVTVLGGLLLVVLGRRRRGDRFRSLPLPVLGGLVAGLGWVLLQGGIHVAIDEPLFYTHLDELFEGTALRAWLPTVGFGALLLLVSRIVRRPIAIAAMLVLGLVGFGLVALAIGASADDVRADGWLLGPFRGDLVWQTWSVLSLTDADWLAVARSSGMILAAAVLVGPVALLHLGEIEPALDRDLDTDRELRDAGLANLAAGALGGIPGAHAAGASTEAARARVDARVVGLIAAAVPLALLLFGATVVTWLPRIVVGGFLAYLGLSLIAAWVWDRRRSLSRIEYAVVWAILGVVVVWGPTTGFVVALALSVLLFAISYGRLDLVHEVPFGETYRSTVDRPPDERERLRERAGQVQILRVSGHVFFGSTNRLLERIRSRARDGTPPRCLVIDLQRVTGVDASAVAAFAKAERLAATHGTRIVVTRAPDVLRARLERGGALGTQGLVTFAADLDRGLQRCEEILLEGEAPEADRVDVEGGMPPRLAGHLDRVDVAEGTVLLRQHEPTDGIYVLVEGRLVVEATTTAGRCVRVRTLRPGVVVGEVAWYAGGGRTADVVAETACVVLRCSGERIARIESDDPEVAAALHRWLAGTLADRLSDSLRTLDALLG